jgi:hypothetical protein
MKDYSYRQENAAALIDKRGFADVRKMIVLAEQRENVWNPWSNPREALIQARSQALNPERLLNKILKNQSFDIQRDYYRRLGDGISPWLLLSWAVMRLTNEKMKKNAA